MSENVKPYDFCSDVVGNTLCLSVADLKRENWHLVAFVYIKAVSLFGKTKPGIHFKRTNQNFCNCVVTNRKYQ